MEKRYGASVTLQEIAAMRQGEHDAPIVAAKLDNVLRDLQTPVGDYRTIAFIDMLDDEGQAVYRRSVTFLLVIAVHELYPDAEVIVQFKANSGLYCDIRMPGGLDGEAVRRIERHMREIIEENCPIVKKKLRREEAVHLFKQSQQIEKANLIASLGLESVSIYYCHGAYDYLYGPMLDKTGLLGDFALDYYAPGGVLLRTPESGKAGEMPSVPKLKPQPKLSQILSEAKRWAGILHCDYVPDLNRHARHGKIGEIIQISEALQEKTLAEIADHIAKHREKLRLILVAGPSSSGKTTFAQRLRIQLRVNGMEPISISLDDYFLDREKTPCTPSGAYDFEALEALDLPAFNDHMLKLLEGQEVVIPRYNFRTGQREWDRHPIAVGKDQPIIIEGIHGLNERLSSHIPRENKYKIYISALTQLNLDAHNRIPTTEARLIRRLVRDHQFRGMHALKTLKQWPDVRAGEERNIFPYQEEADVMFNSALIYELGVLKKYAEPLLKNVPEEAPEYTKAQRLLDFCQFFDSVAEEDAIPNNSILREFIGKSVFSNEKD